MRQKCPGAARVERAAPFTPEGSNSDLLMPGPQDQHQTIASRPTTPPAANLLSGRLYRTAHARQLCNAHYVRSRRGQPLDAPPRYKHREMKRFVK